MSTVASSYSTIDSSFSIIKNLKSKPSTIQFSTLDKYFLAHYWPMFDLSDIVGGVNFTSGEEYSFVEDRHESMDSAIYLNHGFLQIAENVSFFNGDYSDFTIIVGINLKSNPETNIRIFDFGNENEADIIGCNISINTDIVCYYKTETLEYLSLETKGFTLNEWHHLAFTLFGNLASIYVNGCLVKIKEFSEPPKKVARKTNHIGKCSEENKPHINAVYDELKIYKIALLANEIFDEYKKITKLIGKP